MRSTPLIRLAVGFALLVGARPTLASQPGVGLLRPQPKVRHSPYSRLFEVPHIRMTQPARRPSSSAREPREPKVVCGMTLIPVDPDIDPKIHVRPQRDDTRYTIRSITPTVCR